MTFNLRIKGRNYFEPSTAANLLILTKQSANLQSSAANDATVQDLTQYTISRLAGLAGLAIEKAKPNRSLTVDRIKANAYHQHHFGCKTCCAAGQGRGDRCEIGVGLWTANQQEEPTL